MSIIQAADDIRGTSLQGAVGDWARHGDFDRSGSGFNQSPQAVQVTTVTMTDQGDDDDVIITIGGVDVTYNTGTGLALAAIGAAFAAKINLEPLVRGKMRATFDTATLTLTGIEPGVTTTVSIASDPDSVLSAVTAVVVAGSASAIPVGRAVIRQGYSSAGTKLAAIALAARFTAQVITATIVNGVATTRAIRVWEIRGDERSLLAETVFAGSATEATEVTNIVAAVNLALAANTVVAADGAGDTVTFTAEVPGLEFQIEIEQVTTGDITLANTTGPSPSTSLARAFLGMSQRPLDEEVLTVGGEEPAWPGNKGLRWSEYGSVWVASAEAIVDGGRVYVETAAGDDTGKLFAVTSATRIALPRSLARWDVDGSVAADNLAAVRLSVQ